MSKNDKPFTLNPPRVEDRRELSQDEVTALLGANREDTNMNFNQWAEIIYQQNKAIGWWDDENRCIFEVLQLISTELAEATEGVRKDLMDDKLPHRKMEEVELADALIRVLDLGGAYGWRHTPCSTPTMLNHITTNGGMHGVVNVGVFTLFSMCYQQKHRTTGARIGGDIDRAYSGVIVAIEQVSQSLGYDIEGAMREKLEFNKTRPDHQRENRAKPGGLAF